MKIIVNLCKSLEFIETQWKSLELIENHWVFISFQWLSMIFTDFSLISMSFDDFQWFSMSFIDFSMNLNDSSMSVNEFQWCSLISIDTQRFSLKFNYVLFVAIVCVCFLMCFLFWFVFFCFCVCCVCVSVCVLLFFLFPLLFSSSFFSMKPAEILWKIMEIPNSRNPKPEIPKSSKSEILKAARRCWGCQELPGLSRSCQLPAKSWQELTGGGRSWQVMQGAVTISGVRDFGISAWTSYLSWLAKLTNVIRQSSRIDVELCDIEFFTLSGDCFENGGRGALGGCEHIYNNKKIYIYDL